MIGSWDKDTRDQITANLLRLDLKQLRYALETAHWSSFRRAAIELGTTSSCVSRGVRALEDRIGIDLFERSSHGVRLTVEGERFIGQVMPALAQIDFSIRSVRPQPNCDERALRIGTCGCLTRSVLNRLLDRLVPSDLAAKFVLNDGHRASHLESIRRLELDLALVPGACAAPNMSHKVLDVEPLVVALPLDHDLVACEQVQWTALSGQLLLFSIFDGGTDLAHICASVLGAQEIVPLVEMLPVLPDSLFHLVAAGRGASILPLSAYPSARQDVAFKPIAAPDQSMFVSLFWCPHNTRADVEHVVDVACELGSLPKSLGF